MISGPNGSGKTNLLEAISLLVPGRGLRQARVAEFPRLRPDGGTSWAVAARATTPDLAEPLLIGTGSPPEGGRPARVLRLDGARGEPGGDCRAHRDLLDHPADGPAVRRKRRAGGAASSTGWCGRWTPPMRVR